MHRAGPLAAIGALFAVTASALALPVSSAAHRGTAAVSPGCVGGHSGVRVKAEDARKVKEPGDVAPGLVTAIERETDRLLAGRRTALLAARARTPAPTAIRIPVYVHVIYSGSRGSVPAAQIDREIATMNDAYAGKLRWNGTSGGYDTRVSFYVKGKDWTNNAQWFDTPDRYEKAFKSKLHRGDAGSLNLYTADLGDSVLGSSTFPWDYRAAPLMDGVVVHVGTLPGGSIANYNLGYSAVHETGHWLGLYHTFEGWSASTGTGGCQGPGDQVDDTPAEDSPSKGCPVGKNTCANRPGTDPIHNFMDYSYDTCMNQFTHRQGDRIHKYWAAYRAPGRHPGTVGPVAEATTSVDTGDGVPAAPG